MSHTNLNEPIAVVGVACRFPGDATSPSKLWDLICEKRDVQSVITSDRFNSAAFYNADGEKSGCTDAQRAYLLSEDVRHFDASFFRINPLEAEAMDPQQRMLLETVYEATESAGIPIETLEGSDTAVFVGSMTGDYHEMLLRDPQDMPKYMATGTARSILSNRISYVFNWKGPSMTIDTACSSSLVAVHQAVTALRMGVSTMACAAGANLILGPEMMISESKLHMLSPTGRSMMWDAAANGYGRGEGTAAILMKTLSSALKDGDYIHGIIRETGVNSDGHTNGITLPSSDSQSTLIKKTYEAAGLDVILDRCQFFEAHGTGTPAGDPIEARAIYDAFFDRDNPAMTSIEKMYVGSIKTTIGHLEGCAGLAGLIKAMEATRRGIIPPNMAFNKLNPKLQPLSDRLTVATEAIPWPELPAGAPRRASVNSFGFGGTNAHAIIESFQQEAKDCSSNDPVVTPIVLSANSEKSLRQQAAQLSQALQTARAEQLPDILYTLSHRRSQLQCRTFFAGRTAEELTKSIRDAISEGGSLSLYQGDKRPDQRRILGVFTGQGAQWPTMGRGILEESPFARSFIKKLEDSLSQLPHPPSWTLSEQILAEPADSRVAEAVVSQPLCTAVQLMLVELLREAGVNFSHVVGHSSGEIAAAYCAGFLSAEDAIRVAYYRGVCASHAQGTNGKTGAMIAVGLSYQDAVSFCQSNFPLRLDVAAENAPASTTISGDEDAIQEAKALLDAQGVFARILKVNTAYHSRHMIPCSRPYLELMQQCGVRALPGDPTCVWYSSVICDQIESDKHSELLSSQYWCDNMVKTVQFSSAVELAVGDGRQISAVLEIGPHPALKGPFEQTVRKADSPILPYQATLFRGSDDVNSLSKTLGFLWSVLGKSAVDIAAYAACFHRLAGSSVAILPTYPWDHTQSFWKESRKSVAFRKRTQPPHTLLGVRSSEDVAPEMRWLNILRLSDIPWLEGHKVQGQIIFPAAAYLVMAMEAAKLMNETKVMQVIELYDVEILSAITLSEASQGVEASFSLYVTQNGSDFSVANWAYYTAVPGNGSNGKCHARGRLRAEYASPMDEPMPPRNAPAYSLSAVDTARFYDSLSGIGLQYSHHFRSLGDIQRRLGYATASASHLETDFGAPIHPAVLDCSFQSLFAAYCWPEDGTLNSPFVPTSVAKIRILVNHGLREGDPVAIDSYLTGSEPSKITCDINIMSKATNTQFLQLEGLTCTALFRQELKDAKELYTRTKWELDIQSRIRTLDIDRDEESDLKLIDLCERFAYYYLRNLNNVIDRDETKTMEWHYQRIFEWIDELFPRVAAGEHPTLKAEWSNDEYSWLLEEKAKFGDQVDLALIHAVGENLPAVVRGQTTMLEHMVKDDVLERFYKYGLGFQSANGHMSHISKQIAHRYPHMNILEVGGGTGGATQGILRSLGRTFNTYTFTDISTGFFEAAAEQFDFWSDKMIFKPLNIEKDTSAQGFVDGTYDLVIASNVLHATETLSETMRNVRRLIKPGGYLLLLEVTSDIVRVKMMMSGLSGWWLGGDDGRRYGPTITLSEWDTLLRSTGFSGTDDTFNDFKDPNKYMTSVILSQAVDDEIGFRRRPLSSEVTVPLPDALTIVGGKTSNFAETVSNLLQSTERFNMRIQLLPDLETLSALGSQGLVKSVVILQDLDQPVMQDITAGTLSGLQDVMSKCRQLLWVSDKCRKENPYANMSTGLCRSLASEYPHIKMQHIDIEDAIDDFATIQKLAEMVLQFFYTVESPTSLCSTLWSFESELILEHGKSYIPRLVPDEQLNQRLASSSMDIQVSTTLKKNVVEILRGKSNFTVSQVAPSIKDTSSHTIVTVEHALLHPVATDNGVPHYLCYGYKGDEKCPVLALSASNASSVHVSECLFLSQPASGVRLLQRVAVAVFCEQVLVNVTHGTVLALHNEDGNYAPVIRKAAEQLGATCVGTASQSIASSNCCTFIHPRVSQRELKRLLPQEINIFVDFSTSSAQFALQHLLPSSCKFHSVTASATSTLPSTSRVKEIARNTVQHSCESDTASSVIPLSELHEQSTEDLAFGTIIDFTVESSIARVTPLQPTKLFRSDKTYFLVGCTGGLGKALCRWMVASGVRYLALTTRNVETVDAVWVQEIEAAGAELQIYQADVGDKASLQAAYEDIVLNMPPIYGVVNAAMVLADKSFGELDVESIDVVFGPKVRSTQYLHDIFQGQTLDFFIMFSSLASIVGNRGQANYAAANMFMTGIAEQRRARNLSASVIHIGMVLGVGYVSATGTYEKTLRQYNYMPIAETDFLNMFSQAILVGRPGSNHDCELVTGLNRYSLTSTDQQYFWNENSRFSHHYMEEERRERVFTGSKASVSEQLGSATSKAEVLSIIQICFCKKLERILQAEANSIQSTHSLFNLGVDSLVAVEIRSWFLKETDFDIPVLDVLNTGEISELCEKAAEYVTSTGAISSKENTQSPGSLHMVTVPTQYTTTVSVATSAILKSNDSQSEDASDADSTSSLSDSFELERHGVLSFAQERLWFLHEFLRDPTTYNVSMAYQIIGPLRFDDFETALQTVYKRHESLRTGFYNDPTTGLPMQRVFRTGHFHIVRKAGTDYKSELEEIQNTHYDLENGHVAKATMICGRERHILVLGFHHIAFDGYSAHILIKELSQVYSGHSLPSPSHDYLDYAMQQRAAGVSTDIRDFWSDQFETLPPVLPVFDFAECKTRIPLLSYETRAVEKTVSLSVYSQFKLLAQKLATTPFHVHLAALQAALYQLGSGSDMCIGITDLNRAESAYLDTVGFFVNLVPLRFTLEQSQTLSDIVIRSKETASASLAKAMPFDALIDALKIPRSTVHSPLFQVVLNYKLGSTQHVHLGGCEAEVLEFQDARNPFDLTFDIEALADGSAFVSVKTQKYLYTELELRFILDTYFRCLEACIANPEQSLDAAAKLSDSEKVQILRLGKGERLPEPEFETIVHSFEYFVSIQPHAVALREDSGVEVTYSQLRALVSTCARRMQAAGVNEGARVCVSCEPGATVLAALLAIAALGASYVPLDVQNLAARLQHIVDDCKPDAILHDNSTSTLVSLLKHSGQLINMSVLEFGNAEPVPNKAKDSAPGFIMYTSGTTGVPKGIPLTHSNIVYQIDSFIRGHDLKRGVFLQQSSFSFDHSLMQLLLPMFNGGTVQFASSATRKDPSQLAALMNKRKVTHTVMTPTFALALLRHGFDSLVQCTSWEFASVSGEAMREIVTQEFKRLGLSNLCLYNNCGPTEITHVYTSGKVKLDDAAPGDTRSPSIGTTLPNYSTYILDERLRPVRVGAAGELVVGGCGVALGYLHRDELTRAKFLPDPFASEDDKSRGWTRMYRTGDKAKFLPDGRIVFLGRIEGDSQVKLRGFRIELDEIANSIIQSSQGMISEAAVSLRQPGGYDAYLVAFAVMSSSFNDAHAQPFLSCLRKDLPLPQYMIPSIIVPVQQLPMNSSRKLDRLALDSLPLPKAELSTRTLLRDTHEKLKELWLKTLPEFSTVAPIDEDSDFFQVGGNSLRLVLLRDAIRKEFGVAVSVFDLFSHSTLGRMAAKIDDSGLPKNDCEAIDWGSETRLHSNVLDMSYRQAPVNCESNLGVILTGATGFLGSSILRRLLQDPKVSKVYCVAIRRPMETLIAEEPIFQSNRVRCYAGDLARPRLGLSEADFDELMSNAHRIIHNGADVSFLKSYQSLRDANVTSTKEIVRMASRRRIPLHYVSTGGLASLTNVDGLPEASVSYITPPSDGSFGYVASKWASEMYLEAATTQLELPVWIHRPSSIVGAHAPAADLMQTIFRFSAEIKALPSVSGWTGAFDFVPVEDVARSIVSSMHKDTSKRTPIYRHHCGKEKIPVASIHADFESKLGMKVEMVTIEEWLRRALNAGLDEASGALIEKTFSESSPRRVPWLLTTNTPC